MSQLDVPAVILDTLASVDAKDLNLVQLELTWQVMGTPQLPLALTALLVSTLKFQEVQIAQHAQLVTNVRVQMDRRWCVPWAHLALVSMILVPLVKRVITPRKKAPFSAVNVLADIHVQTLPKVFMIISLFIECM